MNIWRRKWLRSFEWVIFSLFIMYVWLFISAHPSCLVCVWRGSCDLSHGSICESKWRWWCIAEERGQQWEFTLCLIYKRFVIFLYLAFELWIVIKPLKCISISRDINFKFFPHLGTLCTIWILYFLKIILSSNIHLGYYTLTPTTKDFSSNNIPLTTSQLTFNETNSKSSSISISKQL